MKGNYLIIIGVLILFIGVAVKPVISTVQNENGIHENPRNYLFQTIIKISRHPEIRVLLNQNNNNLISSNFDFSSLFLDLEIRKSSLISSLFFIKSSTKIDNLNKVYNKGNELIEILGKDKTFEILESIRYNDLQMFDKINKIISKDVELNDRLNRLKEMNYEFSSDLSWNFPVICGLIFSWIIIQLIKISFWGNFWFVIKDTYILKSLYFRYCEFLVNKIEFLLNPIGIIYRNLGCEPIYAY
jgi:hypothetical protein